MLPQQGVQVHRLPGQPRLDTQPEGVLDVTGQWPLAGEVGQQLVRAPADVEAHQQVVEGLLSGGKERLVEERDTRNREIARWHSGEQGVFFADQLALPGAAQQILL